MKEYIILILIIIGAFALVYSFRKPQDDVEKK